MITPNEAFHLSLLSCNMLTIQHIEMLNNFIKFHLQDNIHNKDFVLSYVVKMALFKQIRKEILSKIIDSEIYDEPMFKNFKKDMFSKIIDSEIYDDKSYNVQKRNIKFIYNNPLISKILNKGYILLRIHAIAIALVLNVNINEQLDTNILGKFINNYDIFDRKTAIHVIFDIGDEEMTEYLLRFFFANGCIVSYATHLQHPLQYAEESDIFRNCLQHSFFNSKPYRLLLQKNRQQQESAVTICKMWKKCIACPDFYICRKRLKDEYNSLI